MLGKHRELALAAALAVILSCPGIWSEKLTSDSYTFHPVDINAGSNKATGGVYSLHSSAAQADGIGRASVQSTDAAYGFWPAALRQATTQTPTPSPTSTPTATPSPSSTNTSTATPTETMTPTQTTTSTPAVSPSSTPTMTQSPTETPIVVVTPTHTPTPILTLSPSPTSTFTPTDTPTATATATPTPGFNYDIAPDPPDGLVDAKDLLRWLERIHSGQSEADLLFSFSQHWQSESTLTSSTNASSIITDATNCSIKGSKSR